MTLPSGSARPAPAHLRERLSSLPPSIAEWFTLENAETIYQTISGKLSDHWLLPFADLDDYSQGYWTWDNQSESEICDSRFLQIHSGATYSSCLYLEKGNDDPAVLMDVSEWIDEVTTADEWTLWSLNFSAWIFDCLALDFVDPKQDGYALRATAPPPTDTELQSLNQFFSAGPTSARETQLQLDSITHSSSIYFDAPHQNFRFYEEDAVLWIRLCDSGVCKWYLLAPDANRLNSFTQSVCQIRPLQNQLTVDPARGQPECVSPVLDELGAR